MRSKLVVLATLLSAAAFVQQANASTFKLNFEGPGVSGNLTLTYGTATDAKYSQGYEVTGISGTFSDSNNGLNIVNSAIGSLIPVIHSTPDPTNLLAPNDFSRYAVANGLPPEANGFITYDNLLYPGAAPATATDYQVHGGQLDIYGLFFNIGNGDLVDFWSNGVASPGTPADYGVAVVTSANTLDYVAGAVSVSPEPGALGLMGAGLAGLLFWRRQVAQQKSR